MRRTVTIFVVWLLLIFSGNPLSGAERDPLPSWNDGASKIYSRFVDRVTREGGPDYVKPGGAHRDL